MAAIPRGAELLSSISMLHPCFLSDKVKILNRIQKVKPRWPILFLFMFYLPSVGKPLDLTKIQYMSISCRYDRHLSGVFRLLRVCVCV